MKSKHQRLSFCGSRSPGHARRVSTRRGWAAVHSSAPFTWCTQVALAIRRDWAGDFAVCGRRENGAPARGQKDRQPTVFYPLGTPSSALLEYLGATERKRSYLEVGPKKGTAVPLPVHRPQSAIPFTATLKPLAVCDSIYAKPVQSAAITPRQCGKRQPTPVSLCELLMK